jgi:hypothetical protein
MFPEMRADVVKFLCKDIFPVDAGEWIAMTNKNMISVGSVSHVRKLLNKNSLGLKPVPSRGAILRMRKLILEFAKRLLGYAIKSVQEYE